VEGAEEVVLLPGGEGLRLTTVVGEFTLALLTVEGGGGWNEPPATVRAAGEAFEVTAPFANQNPKLPSSIQTQSSSGLLYATFLGGGDGDWGGGIAVDSSGAAYVTGWTLSSNFPTTPGAFDRTYHGYGDAFVVKLNPSGSGLQDLAYATFLGGGDRDWGLGIAVDSSGAAYVTGWTKSSNFPTTQGAYDPTYNGYYDAFVVKLNPYGTALAYGTFLGGSDDDWGNGIAVDSSGAAYVTGLTKSSDFPTTPGVFDPTHNGGDAFVVKLNPYGTALAYGTFLGGSDDDWGNGIAVDSSGAAYVTGGTYSSDFPTTPGAYDRTYNGGWYDAFVVKLNPYGTALAYSTFLGGGDRDWGNDIAVDSSGAAYVTGVTYSSDFPTTPGAFDRTYHGNGDAFVVKLNPYGSGLQDLAYATFLGGSDDDGGRGIAVDSSGAAYVTGWTKSSNFPTTQGAYDPTHNGYYDAFVVKLNPYGTALAYATFLGGSDDDWGMSIVVDSSGAAYVTGWTWSPDFPTTPGAFDTTYNDGDAFVVKLVRKNRIYLPLVLRNYR